MTIIRAEDKFLTNSSYNPFASYSDSKILRPVVSRPLQGQGKNGVKLDVPGFVGNYTVDSNKKPVPLGVVSDSYRLVQMRDLVEEAEATMIGHFNGDREILDSIEVKDTSARGGAFVKRSYRVDAFKETIDYAGAGITTGTSVAALFTIITGFDGQTKTTLQAGALDVICDNGMVSMTDSEAISKKHTPGANVDIFRNWMSEGLDKFQESIEEIRTLATSLVDEDEVEDVIRSLPGMSARKATAMIHRFNKECDDRGTHAYAVLSAFTYYSSHNDHWFPVRETGNDNVQTTLADRQSEVSRWVKSDAFKSLLAA